MSKHPYLIFQKQMLKILSYFFLFNNQFLLQIESMTQKKLWTQEEDQVLRHLKEDQCLDKWSQISRRMKLIFGKNSRNQKQCRDRYINHLRVKKDKFQWKKEDQDKMIQLHQQLGNKWAAIAQNFGQMTQNFIKNQFYSRLRKSIRKLNKFINESFRRQFKELKLNLIFKLSSIVDGKLKKISNLNPELNDAYGKYLYILISYTSEITMNRLNQIEMEERFVQQLIRPLVTLQQIFYYFNKKNKRKAKQVKLSTFRFNEQIQIQSSQTLMIENELNMKIQEISTKAMAQLKELMDFELRFLNSLQKSMKQQKTQETLQKNQLKEKSKLEDSFQKLQNSVSQNQQNLQDSIELKNRKQEANMIDEIIQIKQDLQIFEDFLKPNDYLSSFGNEESVIRDLLGEQFGNRFEENSNDWSQLDLMKNVWRL